MKSVGMIELQECGSLLIIRAFDRRVALVREQDIAVSGKSLKARRMQ
jgi:hypothetical protein